MEVQTMHATPTLAMLFVALLIIGLTVAAGAMGFAIVRRRGSLGANLALFGAAAVGLCLLLMLVLAGALYPIRRQHQEDVRRAENQARLRQMGEALHNVDALEQSRWLREHGPAEPPIPIEAPQPDEAIALVAGDRERLLRSTPADPLPEWVTTGSVEQGDGRLVVVSSQQFADRDVARQDALRDAVELVRMNFEQSLGDLSGRFNPGTEFVSEYAVKNDYTETIRRTAGDNEFTVYRSHLLVELSPQVREAIEPIWRQQVGQQRSLMIAGLLALLTAIAGIVTGYFRLDDRTAGRYRWRLRLGALAATVLIGGTLFTGTRLAADAIRPPDPLTVQKARRIAPATSVDLPVAPPEARTPPRETPVDEDVQKRFREVADRIVESINAGDYEGLRQDFNKTMLDRFPVEECREFFAEKISDKYGTINTLEPPQFKSDAVAVFAARGERGTLNFLLVLDEHGQVAGMLFRPSRPGGTR